MSIRLACSALAITLALSGCATIDRGEGLGSTDAFAKCAAFDVASTTVGLSINGMHEVNPLTKALTVKALGHVAGTVVPVIGLSIAGYYLLKYIDRPRVTAAAAGVTCFSAARNLWLVR